MKRAIQDASYLMTLWGLMRLSKGAAGDLMIKWGEILKRNPK